MIVTEVKSVHVNDLAARIENAIERIKKKNGLTFKAIASLVGMSTNNLYRIQGGKNNSISLEQLLKIESVVLFPEDYPSEWTLTIDGSLLVARSVADLPLLPQIVQSEQPQSEEAQG